MTAPAVRVEGLPELRRTMRAAGLELAELKDGMLDTAHIVEQRSRALAPVRTGRLAASVRGTAASAQAMVGSSVVYGAPIHYGWPARNIAPHPFITEAAKQTEHEWLAALLDDIDRALGKVHGT